MTTTRQPGLTTRITVGTIGVTLVATLLAGGVLAPLLRSTAEEAVREPLARQASLLGRLPVRTVGGAAAERIAESADLSIGVLTVDGTPSGPAVLLSESERATLLDGRPVSTDGVYAGVAVLVEARPTASGGAVVVATDADVVDDATSALRRRVLLALLVGLAVAVVVGWAVARYLGRPLAAVAAGARRMAAGERAVPLPEPGTREVADVSDALLSLDEALRGSEARQRDFLMSVSHELRTPLTAIRGYADALGDGLVSPAEMPVVARTVLGETERLERYVDDLLALARLQADDFSIQPADVDLAALVLAAAAAWAERGRVVGVEVRAEAPERLVLRTDGGRLRQAIDALVDNAVRVCAAQPGSHRVVISASGASGGVVVAVRDSGPGLTVDDAAVAFTPGALHQRYAGARPGGHGLGLAVVHRLVGLLGGTVRVVPAPEGGAGFEITLPAYAH